MSKQVSEHFQVSHPGCSNVSRALGGLLGFCVYAAVWPGWSNAQPVTDISVEPDPLVRIGTVTGPDEFIFQDIMDAAVLPDGRLLAADRSTGELRIYSRDGQFITLFGGEGEGPQEFRLLLSVDVHDDTIIAVDPMLRKQAYFSLDGEFIGTEPPPRSGVSLVGVTEGGRRWWSWGRRSGRGPTRGVTADSVNIGYSEGATSEVRRVTGAIVGWQYERRPYPFSPVTRPTLLRDSLLIADPVRGELAVFSPSGQRSRVIRVPLPETDAEEAWGVLEREIQVRDDLRQFRGEEIPRVDELPRMGAVLVDGADRIWIKQYDPAEDADWLGGWAGGEGGRWIVLDPEGEVVGRVDMPPDLAPLFIGRKLLLGRYRDELGVQYLSVHRLVDRP